MAGSSGVNADRCLGVLLGWFLAGADRKNGASGSQQFLGKLIHGAMHFLCFVPALAGAWIRHQANAAKLAAGAAGLFLGLDSASADYGFRRWSVRPRTAAPAIPVGCPIET
jgi:hypothetical protein